MRKALKSWRNEQREMLKQYSRQQLLEALVPAAGKGSARQKCAKKLEGVPKKSAKARSNTKGKDLLCVRFPLGRLYFFSRGDWRPAAGLIIYYLTRVYY